MQAQFFYSYLHFIRPGKNNRINGNFRDSRYPYPTKMSFSFRERQKTRASSKRPVTYCAIPKCFETTSLWRFFRITRLNSCLLWNKQRGTVGGASFQRPMSPLCFSQWELLLFGHGNFNGAAGNHGKQFVTGQLQLFPGGDITV